MKNTSLHTVLFSKIAIENAEKMFYMYSFRQDLILRFLQNKQNFTHEIITTKRDLDFDPSKLNICKLCSAYRIGMINFHFFQSVNDIESEHELHTLLCVTLKLIRTS